MVFCLVALVVFGILGIFSAKYRAYFFAALDCTIRMTTLRPCDSQFDRQMKGKIVLKLSKYNLSLARFVGKYFDTISWLLVIAMLASIILILIGIYNYWFFGNCEGPGSSSFCVLQSVFGNRTVIHISQNATQNLQLLNGA